MLKKTLLYFSIGSTLLTTLSYAKDDVSYRTPPKEISDLLLAKPTPSISMDGKAEFEILL
ncbi:hypothetical protein [Daejeonella sp.]|uniref:hypothetical protein n=1 Tax=Daejeonella sp. TaxID=2805397 RepID=UPI00398367AE